MIRCEHSSGLVRFWRTGDEVRRRRRKIVFDYSGDHTTLDGTAHYIFVKTIPVFLVVLHWAKMPTCTKLTEQFTEETG